MLNQEIEGDDFRFNQQKVRPKTGLVEGQGNDGLGSSNGSATIMSTTQNANQSRKPRQKPRDFNEIDRLIFGEAVQTTDIEVEEERPLQQQSSKAYPLTTTNKSRMDEQLMASFHSQ